MIIQGTFVDKETFEGIPFGSIVLANNQTKGTTTDTDTSIPNVVVKGKKWLPYAMYGGGGLLLTLGLIKKNKTLVFGGVLLALAYTSYTMYQKYRYKLGK